GLPGRQQKHQQAATGQAGEEGQRLLAHLGEALQQQRQVPARGDVGGVRRVSEVRLQRGPERGGHEQRRHQGGEDPQQQHAPLQGGLQRGEGGAQAAAAGGAVHRLTRKEKKVCTRVAIWLPMRVATERSASSVRPSSSLAASRKCLPSGSSCTDTALARRVHSKRCHGWLPLKCAVSVLPSANVTVSVCGTSAPARRTSTRVRYGNGPSPGLASGLALRQASRRSAMALSIDSRVSSTRLPLYIV